LESGCNEQAPLNLTSTQPNAGGDDETRREQGGTHLTDGGAAAGAPGRNDPGGDRAYLEVHRSTVLRMLPDLPNWVKEFDGRISIDRSAYLVHVRFNLHEALAVHLAARLLATRLDRHNPHAAAALRKLSGALERLAPHISRHLAQSAGAMDASGGRHDPNYLRSLETLTRVWIEIPGRRTPY
jgi:hypothetical protein